MITRHLTIINKLGLHARAAAKLVATSNRFRADIRIERGGQSVNAKSIMGIMMLAASQGTEIDVSADGEDAEAAMVAISDLIGNRFGEDE